MVRTVGESLSGWPEQLTLSVPLWFSCLLQPVFEEREIVQRVFEFEDGEKILADPQEIAQILLEVEEEGQQHPLPCLLRQGKGHEQQSEQIRISSDGSDLGWRAESVQDRGENSG